MRLFLLAFALALPTGAALAQKPEAPVCKPRFEAHFNTGTRVEADAADEAAARRIFQEWADKENQKRKAAAPGATKKEMVDLALDRVRRLADNCKGLQSFLVF